MSALPTAALTLLLRHLGENYVSHLPPLIKTDKPADELERKNLSRAFSAFVLRHLTDIPIADATAAVVDDFDDYGLDAIYYFAPTETLYLVQSKLKASEQFSQDEALAFCQGVRKLLKQDFSGFNAHVQKRRIEIEDSIENCSLVQLVIAHTGSGISRHAKTAVEELLQDETHGEDRLLRSIVDYDSTKVSMALQGSTAYRRIDTSIVVKKCTLVTDPRTTYFGLVRLLDLVALHKVYDKALYDKNIRTFLGHDTEVNASIQKTLASHPEHFLYLNNGVTVLCQKLEPKGTKGDRKRIDVKGFSVINGAQTIASSARFAVDHPQASIEKALVSITLILADANENFGKSVTRARNHQNPVLIGNFVALDDEQERLRRDLAHLGIHYAYKAGANDAVNDDNVIRADEAVHALALFDPDPRYVVWLKKEPATLLDTSSSRYKTLFTPDVTAFQLANAVRFARYVTARMGREAIGTGPEKLTYKHGVFAFGWTLAKRIKRARDGIALVESEKLKTQLSAAADQLRQSLWDKTRAALGSKSPLGIFRSQAHTLPVLADVLIEHFGLASDPVVSAKKQQQHSREAYPEDLFKYLTSKAPQIGNLT